MATLDSQTLYLKLLRLSIVDPKSRGRLNFDETNGLRASLVAVS